MKWKVLTFMETQMKSKKKSLRDNSEMYEIYI